MYGTKTLFVRLAGCPFTCFYCDTEDALPLDSGTEYSIPEACELIDGHLRDNTFKVNFTGGEPLLQHEGVLELAKYVKSLNVPTYLESSCFDSGRFGKVVPFIDYVKIEFKTRDSEFVDPENYDKFVQNAIECLESAVRKGKTTYIKVVVSSKTELDSFKKLVRRIFDTVNSDDISGFIIQPTTGVAEPNLDQLMEFYDVTFPNYSGVRVVPQLHKLIGAP